MKVIDEFHAPKALFSELEKGEVSDRKDGGITIDAAEKRLDLICSIRVCQTKCLL